MPPGWILRRAQYPVAVYSRNPGATAKEVGRLLQTSRAKIKPHAWVTLADPGKGHGKVPVKFDGKHHGLWDPSHPITVP